MCLCWRDHSLNCCPNKYHQCLRQEAVEDLYRKNLIYDISDATNNGNDPPLPAVIAVPEPDGAWVGWARQLPRDRPAQSHHGHLRSVHTLPCGHEEEGWRLQRLIFGKARKGNGTSWDRTLATCNWDDNGGCHHGRECWGCCDHWP